MLRLCAALALLLAPALAHAQDVGAAPTYGDVQLAEGFEPDPHEVSMTAGGSVAVDADACTYGYVAEAPDVDLYYTTSGGSSLYIYAQAEGDVTLLVNAPGGEWLCDDDGFGGSDPLLVIPNADDGLYDIWIGTYGDEMEAATLYISEIDPRTGDAGLADEINIAAPPTYGDVRVSEGFGVNTTELLAGGTIPVDRGDCAYGRVASAPDVDLYYETTGDGTLYIHVDSEGDTTLLVNQPDGSWLCDDDTGGGNNPILVIPNAPDGLYDIWVGTYGDGLQDAVLTIAETDPR